MKAQDIEIELTAENCQEYFDLFMAPRERQVASFVSMLNQELGEGTLDFSVESLDRAWFYVRDRLEYIKTTQGYENPEELPIWLRTKIHLLGNANEVIFTKASLDLIEKLIFYYGEVVLKTVPNSYWQPELGSFIHIHSYLPYIANYDLGNERDEGFEQPGYIYIGGGLVRHTLAENLPSHRKLTSLVAGYKRFYDRYQRFLALPDEAKYPPPPPPIEVEGRKRKADWMGDDGSVLTKTKGYFEVSITSMAEIELGEHFLVRNDQNEIVGGLDKHFEKIAGVEMVHWYDRCGMQIATTLTKKKLAQALIECYNQLKQK